MTSVPKCTHVHTYIHIMATLLYMCVYMHVHMCYFHQVQYLASSGLISVDTEGTQQADRGLGGKHEDRAGILPEAD